MRQCGQHAGECPIASTSEGTWCTISGFELEGPVYTTFDFRQCCNAIAAPVPARDRSRRLAHSLQRAQSTGLNASRWKQALRHLYPAMSDASSLAWSRAIAAWSTQLSVHKMTHPALRRWALLFTATVASKFVDGVCSAGNKMLLPKVAFFKQHAVPHSAYPSYGVACRAMSATWRKTLNAALAPDGTIQVPFILPSQPPSPTQTPHTGTPQQHPLSPVRAARPLEALALPHTARTAVDNAA